jgi:hypothetical protein
VAAEFSHPALVKIILAVTGDAADAGILEAAGPMALLAGHQRVEAQQGKARQVVVEEHIPGPSLLRVAGRAVQTQLPQVHVVGPVAVDASGSGLILVEGSSVTAITTHLTVGSLKREIGVAFMPECHLRPAHRRVTAFTAGSESPQVLIIRAMARNALGLQLLHLRVPPVAASAVELVVCRFESEAAILLVVEDGASPGDRRMAFLTGWAESAAVNVFQFVTRCASHWRTLVSLIGMTELAARLGVPSVESEVRLRVVELRGSPVDHRVTALALIPEPLPVGIDVPVAFHADTRGIAMECFRLVASVAGHPQVRTLQREIRQGVVE